LISYPTTNGCITVGLALKEQLLPLNESVPKDATDYRIDALILGDGEVLRPHPVPMDTEPS
jgi:hypothetical protein